MSLNSTAATWVTGTVVTAAQLNLEVRDAINGIQAAWTAYTPAWTGTTTNPVIGNGAITGAYLQIGKHIDVWAKVVCGSTTTFGSGGYRLSLPVAPHANFVAPLLCRFKIGATIWSGVTFSYAGSAADLAVHNGTAGGAIQAVTPAIPGTFANLSEIHVTGTYQAA